MSRIYFTDQKKQFVYIHSTLRARSTFTCIAGTPEARFLCTPEAPENSVQRNDENLAHRKHQNVPVFPVHKFTRHMHGKFPVRRHPPMRMRIQS